MRPSQSMAKKILKTVPSHQAFYFYEGLGKPLGEVATSLVDFQEKIKVVQLSSLVFHLRRRDFVNWIRKVIGDSELAERISNVSPDTFDLKSKLYAIVNKRIKELREMLSTSSFEAENVSMAPRASKTELWK